MPPVQRFDVVWSETCGNWFLLPCTPVSAVSPSEHTQHNFLVPGIPCTITADSDEYVGHFVTDSLCHGLFLTRSIL